ncbi:MAG: SMP-30/gluconolactonase/LRE family protein [Pirellulaceae bacterium]
MLLALVTVWAFAPALAKAQAVLVIDSQVIQPDSLASTSRPEIFATGFVGPASIVTHRDGTLYGANYRQPGSIGAITSDWTAKLVVPGKEIQGTADLEPEITGLALDKEGRLLMVDAASGKVLRWNPETGELTTLVDRFEGRHFDRLFAIAIDDAGNLYFTETSRDDDRPQSGSVYRYDIATNRTTRLVSALDGPTGVTVSANGRWLWVAESTRHTIRAIPLRQNVGTARAAEISLKIETDAPPLDRIGHLLLDHEDRLYVTLRDQGAVLVLDTITGKTLHKIPAGGADVYGVALSGEKLITSVPGKEAIFQTPVRLEAAEAEVDAQAKQESP